LNENPEVPNRRAARIALSGTTITGIAGVILAINAISFGVVAYKY